MGIPINLLSVKYVANTLFQFVTSVLTSWRPSLNINLNFLRSDLFWGVLYVICLRNPLVDCMLSLIGSTIDGNLSASLEVVIHYILLKGFTY